MPDTQLSNESIDCSQLDTALPTGVSQVSRRNMVFSVWLDQCERGEARDDLGPGPWRDETLQQFLKDDSRGDYDFRTCKSVFQRGDFWFNARHIPPQSQRPDAGVNEQRHFRDRSAL